MSLRPTSGTVLRRDLTAAAFEYNTELATQGFIADIVAPIHKVAGKTANYPIFGRGNFLKNEDTARKKGKYNRISGEFGDGTYNCEDNGLEAVIDDADAAAYADFLSYENALTRMLTFKVKKAREKRVATMVQDTSGSQTLVAAAVSWGTPATATPIQDVELGLNVLNLKTGIPASMVSLILPVADFQNLCKCTQIIELVKYTFSANNGVRPGTLKAMHIATILGVKEVVVAMGGQDTAAEGEAESLSTIWTAGKAVLAILGTENQPLELPAAYRTMLWTKDSPVFPVMETYRDESVRSDVLRQRANTDEVITAEANLLTYHINVA